METESIKSPEEVLVGELISKRMSLSAQLDKVGNNAEYRSKVIDSLKERAARALEQGNERSFRTIDAVIDELLNPNPLPVGNNDTYSENPTRSEMGAENELRERRKLNADYYRKHGSSHFDPKNLEIQPANIES
ncbi:MAG: hypothetical protein WAZ27_03470 [Minisyncoccia bacterium]